MSQSNPKPRPSDEEIVELYFARDEKAIAETDAKYGKVCMQVSMNIVESRPDAEEATYSQGLQFTSNKDGTCYVSGLGDCTDTAVVIPPVSPAGDKVTGIGERAFSMRAPLVVSVTVPEGVTSIGRYAFDGCADLTDVSYSGNRSQWEAIRFDDGEDVFLSATIHSSDGDLPVKG